MSRQQLIALAMSLIGTAGKLLEVASQVEADGAPTPSVTRPDPMPEP